MKEKIIEQFGEDIEEGINDLSDTIAREYAINISTDIMETKCNQFDINVFEEKHNLDDEDMYQVLTDVISDKIEQHLSKDYKTLIEKYISNLEFNIVRLVREYELKGKCSFFEVVKTIKLIREDLIELVLEEKLGTYETTNTHSEEFFKAIKELKEAMKK